MKRYKIFDYNGKKYLFDGEIVKISEIVGAVNVELNSLNAEGKDINSHRSNYLKSLCLVLNNSCNLCCEYCFANKGEYDRPKEQMTFDIAKNAIDNMVKVVMENHAKNATISFFGGEPLLSFQLMKDIVNYTKSIKNIRFKYMITTNGTLINQEIADYMQANDFEIMISIDGNEKQHNFYRKYKNGKGSYKDVINAIQKFKHNEYLNARITINNNNTDILNCINSILKLGLQRITFAVDYSISGEEYQLYIESLKKLIYKYINDIQNEIYYDITNISSIITSLVLNQRRLTFCNAGISYLTVSADGRYYRCPRFIGHKKFSFSEDEAVVKKMKSFQDSLTSSPVNRNNNCAECTYVYLCGGMCYHHAYSSGLNEFDNVPRECIQRRILFEGAIRLLCELSPKQRRNLLLFYTKLWNTKEGGKRDGQGNFSTES